MAVFLLVLLCLQTAASPCDELQDLEGAETLTCQCVPLQHDDATSLPCSACTSDRTKHVYTELQLNHSTKKAWRTLEQSNYSKSMFCVEVQNLTLQSSKIRLNVEQLGCTVGYEAQRLFAVAQETLDVTRPLHRYNTDNISVVLYFRQGLLPTINHNGNYWEPSVPAHTTLRSLTIRREASVARFGRSQGRNSTLEVLRRWSGAQLGNLSELRVENGDLFHVRGDDLACLPQLTHLTVSNCRTRHFSARSLTNATVNLLAMLQSSAYLHFNCQPDTNSSDVDKVLQKFDRCKTIQHQDQWAWICGSSESKLEYLNLSDNFLSDSTIDVSAFANLRTVILSGNRLTAIPSFVRDLTKLARLDLSRNQIATLDGVHLPNLESLDLSHNQISWWSDVQVFHRVVFVKLSHNAITIMSAEMMQSLCEISFSLAQNPFQCDLCSVMELQSWLVTHPSIDGDELRCHTPDKWRGDPVRLVQLKHCSQDKIYYQVAASLFGVPLVIVLLVSVVLAVRFRFQVGYVWHLVQMRRRAKHQDVTLGGLNQQQRQQQQHTNEYDAFVSYSGADRSWVHDVLLTSLESSERGYSLCLHERDFRLGAYIIDNVAQSMENSRHVILVLSPNFVASQWCQWELKLVQQLMFEQQADDFLVLVELERLPRDQLPSTLRLLMSTYTYLEWTGEQSVFLQRLSNALGKPLARRSDVSLRYSSNNELHFSAKSARVSLRYSTNTDVSLRYSSKGSESLRV